jgi:CRISPR-associated protein Cmr4
MEKEFARKTVFTIQALTNLHCGTGQGVGDIDLPTAKEAATQFPLIPGSSIKGVLRDYHSRTGGADDKRVQAAFGPRLDNPDAEGVASALMITDGRILLLPVRAFAGVFAYATCPLILRRFARDLTYSGETPPPKIPEFGENKALVSACSENLVNGATLLLEELDLPAGNNNAEWEKWCEFLAGKVFDKEWGQAVAAPRLALISDEVFGFLCETALPVNARIRLDEKTGTVARGALWYEESVPSEAVFFGILAATASYGNGKLPKLTAEEVQAEFASGDHTLQFGGKATTGKGLCNLRFWA